MKQPLITVPWITAWSGEAEFSVDRCPELGGAHGFVQPERPGIGVPIFKMRHFVRDRRAVLEGLCGVCGEKLPRNDRWTFQTAIPLTDQGQDIVRFAEPPSHRRCANLAAKACPHIRAQSSDLRRVLQIPASFDLEVRRSLIDADRYSFASAFGSRLPSSAVIHDPDLPWGTAIVEPYLALSQDLYSIVVASRSIKRQALRDVRRGAFAENWSTGQGAAPSSSQPVQLPSWCNIL
jgi:hypothetical protein